MLDALGCRVSTMGPVVSLEPPAAGGEGWGAFDTRLAGSPSAAAYLLAAAAAMPGSHVAVRDVSLNPTRAAFIEFLRQYGAPVGLSPRWEALNEPAGEVVVRGEGLVATPVSGEQAQRLGHELFALVLLAVRARGSSEFAGLPAWFESGDAARIVGYLRSFGVAAETTGEGFVVEGKGDEPLTATRVTTGADPRLAALGILLALSAKDRSVIDDVDCLNALFPKLIGTLRALGARLEVSR
jgi:3-phosphoshikimate 1-carboxyvinyltransferase